jgi:hypothetical protein
MNIREIINIPKGTKFLKDVITELPSDCIFDKAVTGAGGTHIALTSNNPYVICVPYKNLIHNKTERYNKLGYDILGVDGDISTNNIIDYLNDCENTPKIMCTYDALGKVISALGDEVEEYNILIDEFHLLFTNYVFRNKAVRTVLDNYLLFKDFCFMTASTLEEEFILDELKDVDLVIAEWDEVQEVNVKSIKCINTVKNFVKDEIAKYLKGEVEGNAYFFINSVKFIKEIVEECKLSNRNTRAIWSENNDEVMNIENSSTTSKPKKINFITSTCFDGVDLFDKEGVTYIISDGDRQHTLIDISTSFIQIAGRIRDSKYRDIIYHVYTNTRYSGLKTYEDFKKFSQEIIDEAPSTLLVLNESVDILRKLKEDQFNRFKNVIVKEANDKYINYDGERLIIDNNLIKLDLYNYKICKCLYTFRANLYNEYSNKGFYVDFELFDDSKIKNNKDKKKSFKEYVIEIENNPDDLDLYNEACNRYNFLDEAINNLGFDGIKDLKYMSANIKTKLIVLSDRGLENKILRILETKLNLDYEDFYSSVRLKQIFADIYKELDIIKNPKATDIRKYYKCEEKSVRQNKEVVKGFIIYNEKLLLG